MVANQVYVIVSNHQSLADIPVAFASEAGYEMAGEAELFRVPFLGWMLRMAGDVPVDRTAQGRAQKR